MTTPANETKRRLPFLCPPLTVFTGLLFLKAGLADKPDLDLQPTIFGITLVVMGVVLWIVARRLAKEYEKSG